jgi:hypothetical protein
MVAKRKYSAVLIDDQGLVFDTWTGGHNFEEIKKWGRARGMSYTLKIDVTQHDRNDNIVGLDLIVYVCKGNNLVRPFHKRGG